MQVSKLEWQIYWSDLLPVFLMEDIHIWCPVEIEIALSGAVGFSKYSRCFRIFSPTYLFLKSDNDCSTRSTLKWFYFAFDNLPQITIPLSDTV